MKAIATRSLPHERWTAVTDDYFLSNKGRWYSKRSKRILKQQSNSSGYMRATIWYQERWKHMFTHIKVVELFSDCAGKQIPYQAKTLREVGLSIDHVDRNKLNNRQENLEIVTHQENCIRKFTHEDDLPY